MSWQVKFRIWDGIHMNYEGMMIPIAGIQNEKLVIHQFSGLKDKEGRDIYEGDVIQVLEGEHKNHIATVIRSEEDFQLTLNFEELRTYFTVKHQDSIQVVGNVYENENPYTLKV